MFKNWFLSQVARSSWKAFFCWIKKKDWKRCSYNIHNIWWIRPWCRIRNFEYLSPQANSSLCEVLSLPLKVSLLFLKEPPLLFETLLLLQCVAVVKKSCRLIIKRCVELLLCMHKTDTLLLFQPKLLFENSRWHSLMQGAYLSGWQFNPFIYTWNEKPPQFGICALINEQKLTWRSCCCVWMNSLHCCTSCLIRSISSSWVSLGITSLLDSSWFWTCEA